MTGGWAPITEPERRAIGAEFGRRMKPLNRACNDLHAAGVDFDDPRFQEVMREMDAVKDEHYRKIFTPERYEMCKRWEAAFERSMALERAGGGPELKEALREENEIWEKYCAICSAGGRK